MKTEKESKDYIEKIVWPNGPTCAFCGSQDHIKSKTTIGQYYCRSCQKRYTLKSKTVGAGLSTSYSNLLKFLENYLNLKNKKILEIKNESQIRSFVRLGVRVKVLLDDVETLEDAIKKLFEIKRKRNEQ